MNTQPSPEKVIRFHRTRDHSVILRGGGRREPTTPSGKRRFWTPSHTEAAARNGQPPDPTP